jgi:hypothetical protein
MSVGASGAVKQARLRTLKASQWTARVLVAGAFALSSVALCQLAMSAHIPGWLAWIWPICTDGMIFQSTTSAMALGGRKDPDALSARRWFQWMTGVGVTVSVAANGLHAWTMLGNKLTWWEVTAVAVVPPILLLIATHGVTLLAGLDDVASLGDDQAAEQEAAEPQLPQVRIERVDRPAHLEQQQSISLVESEPHQAISAKPAAQLPVVAEQQVALEPAAADQPPQRPATIQRDPERVLTAQQLAAAEVPVSEIADKLGVSTRTVRRYLRVEVEETTVTPPQPQEPQPQERPQLFAVSARDTELEVINA